MLPDRKAKGSRQTHSTTSTMIRRSFLQTIGMAGAAQPLHALALAAPPSARDDRAFWIDTLGTMVRPVLANLAAGQLRARMPVEVRPGAQSRADVSHLEAFGRSLAGIAPWLELGEADDDEGRLRAEYIALAQRALAQAVDPGSPDYMNWTRGGQPLVDAAFLAHAIVRSPRTLQAGIDEATRRNLVRALEATRAIVPGYSNWLLFSAMVEIALLKLDAQWDATRVDLVLRKLGEWYLGDGIYGDGPEFHWDYYNSFVIHRSCSTSWARFATGSRAAGHVPAAAQYSRRYAAVLERLIAPDGTFPVIPAARWPTASARSAAGTGGAHAGAARLAAASTGAQRAQRGDAASAGAPGTYDAQGWLRLGLYGSQPGIAESYISTGSLYLAATVFLPLGLPQAAPFWSGPAMKWTAQRAWSGEDIAADHAL
jgi:hypothetical protein